MITLGVKLPFLDRAEAGRLLAKELSRHNIPAESVVLALPRGGLPVGFEVAKELELPLDVIVVRKLGVPWHQELAMGAIAGSVQVLDTSMIRQLGISREEVDEEVVREQAELRRRETLYRSGRAATTATNLTAILVDDGLATGSTMLAALRHVHTLKPAKVIVAVPVGSAEACALMRLEADRVVCLATPSPFVAVGKWYQEFEQLTDGEVQSILARTYRRGPGPGVAGGTERLSDLR